MKKFAICCLAIAVVALFAPAAFAVPVTTCYHLTYFCDGVQATGPQGGEDAGLWDWVCLANGTGTLTIGPHNKFGSQPLYPYSFGSGQGFAANFVFKPAHVPPVFNLPGTTDGATIFYFQKNSPFTTTSGPCNPLHVQKARQSGLKPATIR